MENFSKVAAQVRGARALLGWSQSYLAEGISVRRVIIADLESWRTAGSDIIRLDNGTERGWHRLYGNQCRVCGVAAETLRTDRMYDAKEAREETMVFEDGADE